MDEENTVDYVKGNGNIPLLSASGESIPEAWENSVVELFNNGLWYHRSGRKDKEKLQVDSTMVIEIKNPNSGLLYHKYMTCGHEDLLEYQMEILGAKNSWVDPVRESTGWTYHYHERLTKYPGIKGLVDQIEEGIIQKLKRKPATRQANAITWVPEKDNESDDPPCLQRIWIALVPDENSEDDRFVLNMSYHFRSRNVMIAAPMNQFGLRTLQSYFRGRLIEETDKEIINGRIIDISDSYHVSAQDQHILKGFIERLERSKAKKEKIEDRSYTRDFFNELTEDVYSKIEEKIIAQTQKIISGEELGREIEKIRGISRLVREINHE
jgi:thymidylate synthase